MEVLGRKTVQIKIMLKRQENLLYIVNKAMEEAMKVGYTLSHLIALHSKPLVWKASLFRGARVIL
jgi:hypothetical protein